MRYNSIIKNFSQQWQALKNQKDDNGPEVPKISKNLLVNKWTKAFDDYLHCKVGSHTIPLAYITREMAEVLVVIQTLAAGILHSEEHGSVEGDLVACASHTHPVFHDDNTTIYYDLEEATHETSYAASIKPSKYRKDGRGAWSSIMNQYVGQDKCLAEIKAMDDLLHN